MFGLGTLLEIEKRGLAKRSVLVGPAPDTTPEARWRIVILFLVVVAGILANWFWLIGWDYLGNPSKGLQVGPTLTIIVRVILSFIAAFLTFIPTIDKIGQSTSESWVPFLLAFQNGFFWQAAFETVTKQFHAA